VTASVRAASKLRIAALRLDKARRSYRSSAANSEVFSSKMLASFSSPSGGYWDSMSPNLIDVDKHRAGALMAHSHLSDPQLLLVDLGRLEPRIDE
jgi:hypothetical protein